MLPWKRFLSVRKIQKQNSHMIKCSLTELGLARWENIRLSVKTHGPRAIYFPFPPSHQVSKYILRIWYFAVLSFPNLWLFEKKRSCIRKLLLSGGWVTVFCLCACVFFQSGWRWNLFDYGWWSKCIESSRTGRKGGKKKIAGELGFLLKSRYYSWSCLIMRLFRLQF